MSHKLSVDSPTVDDEFSLSRPAVSIHRHVEVYQWVEHHKTQERKLRNGETEVQAHASLQQNSSDCHATMRWSISIPIQRSGSRGSRTPAPSTIPTAMRTFNLLLATDPRCFEVTSVLLVWLLLTLTCGSWCCEAGALHPGVLTCGSTHTSDSHQPARPGQMRA